MKENTLFIGAESLLCGVYKATGKTSIDLDTIELMMMYIRKEIINHKYFKKYSNIVMDVNDNSIRRLCIYRSKLFELDGERVYIVGNLDKEKHAVIDDAKMIELIRQYFENNVEKVEQ